jgi:beta-N-acetylhexosaminidase
VTAFALVAGALAGCDGGSASSSGDRPGPRAGASASREVAASDSPTLLTADARRRAAALAARLGPEDLVGQMLMPFAYGDSATDVSTASRARNRKATGVDTPAEIVARYRLGGVMLVRFSADDPTASTNPTSNIESPAQVRRLTGGLQEAARRLPAGVPLLIATDQEHGTVTRIRDGVTLLPSAMAFGAAADPALTEAAALVSGTELAALGVTVDFAPDADVTGGPVNVVIGSRSFGSDPARVGPQVAAAVRGYQRAGVAATIKHFPGHGHTGTDSHRATPVLTQSRATLDVEDLGPFRAGIRAGAALVMSGHLDVAAIEPGVPASLSRRALVDVLRRQLGFQGVVVTDGMGMPPVATRYPPGEAAVRAVLAGNDLLLLPPDLGAAYRGLLDAIRSGRLPRARAVEAVTRLLTLKLALAERPQPPLTAVATDASRATAARAAAAAVTLYRGACSGALVRGPVRVTGGLARQRAVLEDGLRAAGVRTGGGGDTVHLTGYGDTAKDLRPATVTIAMDTPYLLRRSGSRVLLATFSGTEAAVRAAAAVLAGRARAPGRSPVAVAGLPARACG